MHLCWNLSDSIDWFCTLVDFQLPNHCKFFMWEDKYEAYLVDNGLLPFDIGSPDDAMTRVPAAAASMEAFLDELKVAVSEVQETMEEMKGAIVAIPPVLTAMRNTMPLPNQTKDK